MRQYTKSTSLTITERYNTWMGWYQKMILPKVIEKARGVVLEIGAGSGLNLPFYQNVSKLYFLEPSKELTAMARERAKDISYPIEFMDAGAEQIPLVDASVDTAVSTWTLCSIGDPAKALREMRRVLKPDGQFVFIDHGISPNPFIRIAQKILTPFMRPFTGNCHMNRDIPAMIEKAGFRIIQKDQFHEKGHPLIFNTHGVAQTR